MRHFSSYCIPCALFEVAGQLALALRPQGAPGSGDARVQCSVQDPGVLNRGLHEGLILSQMRTQSSITLEAPWALLRLKFFKRPGQP